MSNAVAPYAYPHHSTAELLEMNRMCFREWEADKDNEGKRIAVIRTSQELTRRGA